MSEIEQIYKLHAAAEATRKAGWEASESAERQAWRAQTAADAVAIEAPLAAFLAALTPGCDLHLDVESTSLTGTAFAFGAVVCRDGQPIAEFGAIERRGDFFRSPQEAASEWVQNNVLPHCADLYGVPRHRDLLHLWWRIWSAARTAGARLILDCPMPVEGAFLLEAHRAARVDLGAGEFDGPYMPIDVAATLAALGHDPDLSRRETAARLGERGAPHNPINDARHSAAVFYAALQGRL